MAPLYDLFCVVSPRLGHKGIYDVLMRVGSTVLRGGGSSTATSSSSSSSSMSETLSGTNPNEKTTSNDQDKSPNTSNSGGDSSNSGVVTSISSFGLQKLAYPIKEQGHGKHTEVRLNACLYMIVKC